MHLLNSAMSYKFEVSVYIFLYILVSKPVPKIYNNE